MILNCSICKEEKPASAFGPRKDCARGYDYRCRVCKEVNSKKWRGKNSEKVLARAANYRQKNQERIRAYAREHIKKSPAKASEWRRAHEARQLNALPAWSDREKCAEVYEVMQAWNSIWPDDPVHVDHVIPLKSDVVCGLHVHNNLQILRAADNVRKFNKLVL